MDTNKRLKLLISNLNLNITSFSKEIGIKNNVTIMRIVREGNSPSYKIIYMIKSRYPNLNLNWLLFDQGPMWLDLLTWKDEIEESIETHNLDKIIKKQLNEINEEDKEDTEE